MAREFTDNELLTLELQLRSGAPMRLSDLQDLITAVREAVRYAEEIADLHDQVTDLREDLKVAGGPCLECGAP